MPDENLDKEKATTPAEKLNKEDFKLGEANYVKVTGSITQLVDARQAPFWDALFPGNRLVEIPPRHDWFWQKTTGAWIWHPQIGLSGPEGNGPGSTNFFIPQANAGSLCALEPDSLTYWLYEIEFDRSRGGQSSYHNHHDRPLRLYFGCNDDPGGYEDNTGGIIQEIKWYPI